MTNRYHPPLVPSKFTEILTGKALAKNSFR